MNITEKRRARIESTFEIWRPGDSPLSISAGECWTEERDVDVVIHLGGEPGQRVVHISHMQFHQAVNNHQLVFVSW
jgi:hypothetical protein